MLIDRGDPLFEVHAGFDRAQHVVAGAEELDDAQCSRFFDLLADTGSRPQALPEDAQAMLVEMTAHRRQTILEEMGTRNGRWFDTEVEKLDHWAEDRSESLKAELAELDESLKSARKAARTAPSLPEKLERQQEIRRLDARRNEAWKVFDQASNELSAQKEALLDEIEKRLEQRADEEVLFTLRWKVL